MTFSRSSSISFFIVALIAVLTNPAISTVTKHPHVHDHSFCESWRLTSETNNAGSWKVVPFKCVDYVKHYMHDGQFDYDYNQVVSEAIAYAQTIKISGDGKDAWIFDVDETLLSNIEYYSAHGYGSERFDNTKFSGFVAQGTARGLIPGLRLFYTLKKFGFTIILLSERDERLRRITEQNLRTAHISDWNQLILRGTEDQGKASAQFKSEQRSKMTNEGYRIHGNIGDQWSDLEGYAVGARSFKVPNPLYYIPTYTYK